MANISSGTNYMGAWNPNTTYWGTTGPGGVTELADEVEYEGAYWIANYNSLDISPAQDIPGDSGAWKLDPADTAGPNYNPAVPSAPTGFTKGYTSSSEVALFWQPAAVMGQGDVTSYDVYENGALIGTTTSTSLTVKNLAPSTKYTFTVDASNVYGTSGTEAVVSSYGVNENPDPGANPTLSVTTTAAQTSSGKYFSPYVDMTLPSTDLLSLSQSSGLRSFTLAFMQTTSSELSSGQLKAGVVPTISWGGLGSATSESTGTIIQEVKAVEQEGGTITVSIGGYNGTDPAVAAVQYMQKLEAGGDSASVAQKLAVGNLEAEYQSVITTYGVNSLDFDIENQATVNNTTANEYRDLAIKALETADPSLSVSFTLAVTPRGLADTTTAPGGDDLYVLKLAKAEGVTINTVNIMAMDYYNGSTNMLSDAESAARYTEAQLSSQLGLNAKIGLTPMIGQNDDYGASGGDGVDEVFSLDAAKDLELWASTQSYISGLGEWELPRDNAETTAATGVAPSSTSSGVVQSAYEFAKLLNLITVGSASSANAAHAVAKSTASLTNASSGSTGLAAPTPKPTDATHASALILFGQFAAAHYGSSAAGFTSTADGKTGVDMNWASLVGNRTSALRA
jgi:hypothetical protein